MTWPHATREARAVEPLEYARSCLDRAIAADDGSCSDPDTLLVRAAAAADVAQAEHLARVHSELSTLVRLLDQPSPRCRDDAAR